VTCTDGNHKVAAALHRVGHRALSDILTTFHNNQKVLVWSLRGIWAGDSSVAKSMVYNAQPALPQPLLVVP
jgi:hypothetical protein